MPMPAPTPARAMVARPAPRPLLTMLIHNHHFYTGVQEELGGLFPGVHRVNIEVPTRNGDGCSCVRGARSPCWTSRNEGHPVANKRCEDEGDESDVT